MALNRILMLPVVIGGIIAGLALPALGATSIPLPTAPRPHIASVPAELAIAVRSAPGAYQAGAPSLYTVLVRNQGRTAATGVPVMLVLPPSSREVRASAAGMAEYGGVVWTADIKPMHEVTLRAVAVNGRAASDIEDVATTACVLKTPTTRQLCTATLLPIATLARETEPRR
jgi:uncharacterized repeat protein (TIGR01451 family)